MIVIGLKQKREMLGTMPMKHGTHPETWEKILGLGAYGVSPVQSFLGNLPSDSCDLHRSTGLCLLPCVDAQVLRVEMKHFISVCRK